MLAPIQFEEEVVMAVNGIEIAVGQRWRTRCGDVVRVGSIDGHHDFPVNLLSDRTGEEFGSCGKNGKAWGDLGELGDSSDDLVHLLSDDEPLDGKVSAERNADEVKPAVFVADVAIEPDRSVLTIEVPKGYEKLFCVLADALDQAANGKGKDRHASAGVPFEDQPMSSISRTLGSVDGMLYQASKKAGESRRLPDGRAQAEILGAINYLAGVHIAYDSWFKEQLPK